MTIDIKLCNFTEL